MCLGVIYFTLKSTKSPAEKRFKPRKLLLMIHCNVIYDTCYMSRIAGKTQKNELISSRLFEVL